ncbi:hypothetical protein [Rhodoferax koreensis]|uniref:hypothetical protein n=1 Tax=Rhodoferax koreensis TaxID=1842727 RepID=UPI0012FFB7D9|nr:hypothetical protein [Rhodoferax koreense]
MLARAAGVFSIQPQATRKKKKAARQTAAFFDFSDRFDHSASIRLSIFQRLRAQDSLARRAFTL